MTSEHHADFVSSQPTINSSLLGHLAGQLPVSTIILLLEHIAISKSFGRVNNYKIGE